MSDARACPSRPPRSDVSTGVGLVGLCALAGWVAVCRNWAVIADALHIGGPRAPMSGPYAALAAVVLTGGAMALWSVLVDKVHRRATTGLDWARRRPWRAVLATAPTKLAGLWATWAAIGFFYCTARWYWDGPYRFAMEVIGAAAVPLLVLSVPYVLWLERHLVDPHDGAWHFGALVTGRDGWDPAQVSRHWRAWAIKAFFGAFMISILPAGFARVVETDFTSIAGDPVALGTMLVEVLFLVDVQIGTVGYLLTLRPLDAHIRSGNPLLAAWVAALLCYPPFVWGTMGRADVLGYQVNTGGWAYWLQGHAALAWLWAALLVGLTAIYAWATVAFGLRFSNLTHRGVLTHGPYRFTRHPAYLSKNLFWWASTLPFLVTSHSLGDALRNTVLLATVSAIYYWRARTEEAHLLAEDPRYRDYHAWMERNGLVTRPLSQALGRLLPRPAQAQPAE